MLKQRRKHEKRLRIRVRNDAAWLLEQGQASLSFRAEIQDYFNRNATRRSERDSDLNGKRAGEVIKHRDLKIFNTRCHRYNRKDRKVVH